MYKQLRIREVSKKESEKEHMNGENYWKIPKSFYDLSGDARELNSVRFPRKNGFFSPAGPGPAFSPEIRLIGSLQPLRSETPKSVRIIVDV